MVSPGDHQALKATVNALYRKYLTSNQSDKEISFVRADPLEKYSRRQLTGELAQLLEKVSYTCSKKQ